MVWAIRKAELYDLAIRAGWPKPYYPFMIQTRPPEPTEEELKARKGFRRAGVFVMFSNWQDGFFKIMEIAGCKILKNQSGIPLRDFCGDIHQVTVLYENQITNFDGRDSPCRIILDCDLSCAKYKDKFTLQQMIASTDEVPLWFVRRLVEINAIKKTDIVWIVEKDKSRSIKPHEIAQGGGKVSKHYTFNILGLSKGDIYKVLYEVFKKPFLDKKTAVKVSAGVEEDTQGSLISHLEIADVTTMHGNNQFSVMLLHDPKKKETRNPVQTAEIRVSQGGTVVERFPTPWADTANDPDHPDALRMLEKSCYSNFVANSITLHPRFMEGFHEGESRCKRFLFIRETRSETRTHTHPRPPVQAER